MVFSSTEFLFWFLPCFLVAYFLVPNRLKNGCMLLFSLFFYICSVIKNPAYIPLLPLFTLINFGAALLIEKDEKHKKIWLVVGLILNFGNLALFKYVDFITENLNSAFSLSLPVLNLALPVGISFYTFQNSAYIVDVYKKKTHAEKNIITFATHTLMFSHLVSGPIVRYPDILPELRTKKKIPWSLFYEGITTFILGLAYKVIIANRLGGLWTAVGKIGYESVSTPMMWLGIIAYSLQLYFDFCGYSLMAVGLGKMTGFTLPENFNLPYISKSMTEFWRRWHITLGSWFRDYIYIPLGGNRCGKARTYFNLFVVWMFTALWHGANWNFVLWGLLLFICISVEKAGLYKVLDRSKIAGHVYMAILIPVQWMIFAIPDLEKLGMAFGRLVGVGGVNVYAGDFAKYLSQYGIYIFAGLLFATGLPGFFYKKIRTKWFEYLLLIVTFAYAVYCIFKGMNDPFMYFNF